MLFDWLVTGQVIPSNPAHAVRGPKHSVKKGKTSVLSAEEMGTLLNSIPIVGKEGKPILIGLRDRALIGLMGYTFARVGAAVQMKVEDYYIQKRRGWVRLHEKGGKVNELPCNHNLEQFLDEWIEAAHLEKNAPLFPTMRHGKLSASQNSEKYTPLPQENVRAMIQRRATAAGIATKISCHSFRATGITTYLQNNGSSKSRSKWPAMNPREQPDSTTGETMLSRSMKSSGSCTSRVPRLDNPNQPSKIK